MNYKKITILALLIVLISTITTSKSDEQEPSDFDPTIEDWYKVEEWEVEYCKKWGGEETGAEVNSGATSETTFSLSQTTITLQGESIEYDIENQSNLYYASWYIEPMYNIEYKLMFREGNNKYYIQNGTATYDEPKTGFFSEYINQTFTYLRLEYTGNSLEVPLS